VFFTRGGNVMAQSFNEETLRLEGDPVPLRAQLRTDMPGNRGFSVSTNGRLVFLLAPKTERQLTWWTAPDDLWESLAPQDFPAAISM
jgi:hypothetical protein